MPKETAPVSGFVRSFVSGEPIADATITVLENRELGFKTDSAGRFGPFEWPVGQAITLVFEKEGSFWSGYKTVQTATLIVPPEGFNHENYLKNISFQVPSNMAYMALSWAMGIAEIPNTCQIAATITAPNTTMDDIPQGIADVTVTLTPTDEDTKPLGEEVRPYYFGVFPLIHKTNPYSRTLTATSLDGGIAFTNVPPGNYILEARKEGCIFSKVSIKAYPGMIVNASPPFGPTLMQEAKAAEREKKSSSYGFFKPAMAVGLVLGVGAGIIETVFNKSS